MISKLFLFDCDETLWHCKSRDYISHVKSELELIEKDKILRLKDNMVYSLRENIAPAIKYLFNLEGTVLGVISDNKPSPVKNALKLFNIWDYFEVFNTRLWKGYCPKHEMIKEILDMNKFNQIKENNVFWFDDKDYTAEARGIGVNFYKVEANDDLLRIVKRITI